MEKNGNSKFEERLTHFLPWIRERAHKFTSDPGEVDEIVQETCLQALTKLDSFRGSDDPQFLTWLHRIELNAFRAMWRRSRRHRMNELTEEPRCEDPAVGENAQDDPIQWFRDLLPELPERYGEIANAYIRCADEGKITGSRYTAVVAEHLNKSNRSRPLTPHGVRRSLDKMRGWILDRFRWGSFVAALDFWDLGHHLDMTKTLNYLATLCEAKGSADKGAVRFWDEMTYQFALSLHRLDREQLSSPLLQIQKGARRNLERLSLPIALQRLPELQGSEQAPPGFQDLEAICKCNEAMLNYQHHMATRVFDDAGAIQYVYPMHTLNYTAQLLLGRLLMQSNQARKWTAIQEPRRSHLVRLTREALKLPSSGWLNGKPRSIEDLTKAAWPH